MHINYLGNIDTIVQEFQIYFLVRQRWAVFPLKWKWEWSIIFRWKDPRLRYFGLHTFSSLYGEKWMADRIVTSYNYAKYYFCLPSESGHPMCTSAMRWIVRWWPPWRTQCSSRYPPWERSTTTTGDTTLNIQSIILSIIYYLSKLGWNQLFYVIFGSRGSLTIIR